MADEPSSVTKVAQQAEGVIESLKGAGAGVLILILAVLVAGGILWVTWDGSREDFALRKLQVEQERAEAEAFLEMSKHRVDTLQELLLQHLAALRECKGLPESPSQIDAP